MERTEPAAAPALLEMYQAMVLVREAEQALVRLFAENGVPGFLHSYIGEEATAVAGLDVPVPFSPALEEFALPDAARIVDAVRHPG